MDTPDPFAGYSAEEVLDAWDAVRARRESPSPGRIIAAEPLGFWRAYRARWAAAPFHVCLIAIILGGFVLPWGILIGGLLLLTIWTAIFG